MQKISPSRSQLSEVGESGGFGIRDAERRCQAGRLEELPERLEASGYDIPANEIGAGMELHLPCPLKVGQGSHGYKYIEEFLPDAAQ